jgi:hypothetical protein
MTLREDTAFHLGLIKFLTEKLGAAKASAAGALTETWRPGDRNAGALPSGAVIASVTYAKGRTSARVSDRETFEAWVKENHPTEIETVTTTRVSPAYEALLTSAAKQFGVAIDATTGEEVPGITVGQGEPYAIVKLSDDAESLITQAWQDGELTELLGGILRPQIEAIPASEL